MSHVSLWDSGLIISLRIVLSSVSVCNCLIIRSNSTPDANLPSHFLRLMQLSLRSLPFRSLTLSVGAGRKSYPKDYHFLIHRARQYDEARLDSFAAGAETESPGAFDIALITGPIELHSQLVFCDL